MASLPPEEVGQRIRAARLAKGLTVEQLAQEMGVNWRTITHWQKGRDSKGRVRLPRMVGEKGMQRLAEVLEVPISHFVEGPEERTTMDDLVREVEALTALVGEQTRLLRQLVKQGTPAQPRKQPRPPRARAETSG